jgi:hypothetical protein
MNSLSEPSLALFNLGGGEIILILILLFILAAVAAGLLGLVYVIIRAASSPPSPVPRSLPPELPPQELQARDHEQLGLLAIFHFVFAGLALLGMVFVSVHYAIMHTLFSNPEIWKAPNATPPPKVFLDAFIWLYLFLGLLLSAVLILNVLSGIFLRQKKHRIFSFLVAGLDCLQIPFGTALGVFTILVLSRPSVRQLYPDQ